MSFEQYLKTIAAGDPVAAGTVNKPLRQVDQNTRYLWELIQASAIGSTVYARKQTVEAAAKVGMPVYLDTVSQSYLRGLATAEVDEVNGVVATAPSSQVWGIIANKHSSTLADILLFGVANIDITEAVASTDLGTGIYYLSGSNPGRLTRQKPPVSVAVLRRTAAGTVFVMPQFVDYLDRHTHYKFNLVCRPAGTTSQPAVGEHHVITDANSLLTGWLPADHEVFAGKAPAGAVFGYNLSAQPKLANIWPPIPVSGSSLEWNKGLSADVGFTDVPLGENGLAILNRDGIWWMSSCYGDVPWPVDFSSADSSSMSESITDQCPRLLSMEMLVYFTKVNFATDAASVLSLRSTDPRLKVNCYGTSTPATTGNLQIELDLNLIVKTGQPGYLALKDFDPASSTFTQGPVVEGLYAGSANVNMSGSATSTRIIEGIPETVFHGLVAINVDPADTKELDIQIVRLDGVEEEYFGSPPLMYLGFEPAVTNSYRSKIHIPFDLAINTPKLKLRFEVLGTVAGTLPNLTVTARRVSRPASGLTTPVSLPLDATEFSVSITTAGVLSSANQYVEADATPFTVAPGDTVYVHVSRSSSDGYLGTVGILRQSGIVVSGA